MINDASDHVSTLVKLGFSNNQAKVYLALAFLGTSSANDVANFSKITREEVYRKLVDLEKMGFVERIFTKPAMFRATEIKNVISTMLDLKTKESSQLKLKIKHLLNDFKKRNKKENNDSDKPEIVLIPERKPLLEKTKKEIQNVKSGLDIIYSWKKGIAWISSFHDLIMNALDRNVRIRFIIERYESKLPRFVEELQENPSFQIKTVHALPIASLSIYDQKTLLIETLAQTGINESHALWSNNPSIVGMAKVYFETAWINGASQAA